MRSISIIFLLFLVPLSLSGTTSRTTTIARGNKTQPNIAYSDSYVVGIIKNLPYYWNHFDRISFGTHSIGLVQGHQISVFRFSKGKMEKTHLIPRKHEDSTGFSLYSSFREQHFLKEEFNDCAFLDREETLIAVGSKIRGLISWVEVYDLSSSEPKLKHTLIIDPHEEDDDFGGIFFERLALADDGTLYVAISSFDHSKAMLFHLKKSPSGDYISEFKYSFDSQIFSMDCPRRLPGQDFNTIFGGGGNKIVILKDSGSNVEQLRSIYPGPVTLYLAADLSAQVLFDIARVGFERVDLKSKNVKEIVEKNPVHIGRLNDHFIAVYKIGKSLEFHYNDPIFFS